MLKKKMTLWSSRKLHAFISIWKENEQTERTKDKKSSKLCPPPTKKNVCLEGGKHGGDNQLSKEQIPQVKKFQTQLPNTNFYVKNGFCKN